MYCCPPTYNAWLYMHRPETWPDFHISDSDWIKTGNGFDFILQWYDTEKH